MSELYDRLPSPHLPYGSRPCHCAPMAADGEPLRLVVLTGGPGAGKTAVLQAARNSFCSHVAAIPEAASIVFLGGFPRHETFAGKAAAQRAIYHVQREGERLVDDEGFARAALCDRGTIDGAAYWPGDESEYWDQFDVTREAELARYALVIHLETPRVDDGYEAVGMRTEDARTAHAIDERIKHAWRDHPNRIIIPATHTFEDKLVRALDAMRELLPTPNGDVTTDVTR